MLEKIKNLQWHFQLLLLVGIATLGYLTVWYFFTSVTREEVRVKNEEVAKLEAQNNAARVATQRINEFRALYATKMVEYEELKVLLPEQREITNVLQGLQDNARDSRMIVMRFSPRDDTQQETIMAKPVEIEVDANFTSLRAFFDKMAKLPRIVSISDFKLNQLEKQTAEKTLHAQFLLTAYYADPEMINKPAPDPKAKKGAKGKAAAAAPNAQPAAPAAQ
ncbi:MAG TPA: type 4a pilus biogenesis protein PilO [Pyrinomonadaceae bacterium]|nr:type 4a pilus biogenesis protein PilO [Pyrinomonadaceae bacterium]